MLEGKTNKYESETGRFEQLLIIRMGGLEKSVCNSSLLAYKLPDVDVGSTWLGKLQVEVRGIKCLKVLGKSKLNHICVRKLHADWTPGVLTAADQTVLLRDESRNALDLAQGLPTYICRVPR